MSNKIVIDDDHFYAKKPDIDNTKLRGKKRNTGVINDPNEIDFLSFIKIQNYNFFLIKM